MATAQHEIEYYLEAARELAGKVAATADRIDDDRQIPTELAEELADRGFFRLLLPRSLGGAQLDHPDFLRVLEIFAAVDASTGWCLNQNNVFSTNSLRMPEQTAREIWGEKRAVVTNGPPTASSQAVPVDGGYKLNGRWHFSSGSSHATWIAALAPINSGGSSSGPTRDAFKDRTGARIMLMPKEAVTFLDFWQVRGMRGTASFSFEVEDLFIPIDHSYDPTDPPREDGALYTIPMTLLFGSGFATVALGVARAALDTAISVAGDKTPGRTSTLLQDLSATQRIIGEGEAIWGSSLAFLRQSASTAWESAQKTSAQKKRALPTEERINLRLAATHAIRMAAQVVDLAYNLCGSDAIFETNPIQRQFQDIHVITQHGQGRLAHYETAGQHFLGLEPKGNF
jgi:alkylation response protein AidB-like acyl-CoA dehydrogenase